MGCLYRIDFPSGKSYIGVTSKPAEWRLTEHKNAARSTGDLVIHKAIRKYGENSCTISTLVISDDDDYLKAIEVLAIKKFNTLTPNGYNMTSGGNGVNGPSSLATKRRVAAFKKTAATRESIEKRREIHRKAWDDDEKRAKRSEMVKELWKDPAYRKHMIEAHAWQRSDLEYRKNAAKRARDMWKDPKYRARIIESKRRARIRKRLVIGIERLIRLKRAKRYKGFFNLETLNAN